MKGALAILALGTATATASLAVALPNAAFEAYVSTSASTPGARMLRLPLAGGGVEEIPFEGIPVLTGDSVASADAFVAPGGRGEVRLALTPDGARALAAATSRSVGKRLGIVVDGRLLAAPVLMAPLRDGTLVIGGLTLGEAQALAPRLGPSTASERAKVTGPPDSSVLAALEGTWTLRGGTLNGVAVPDRKMSGGTWTFRKGTLEATNGVGEFGKYSVASEAEVPGSFRLDPVPPTAGGSVRMLFRREGDRLTLGYFDGSSKTPADLSPEPKKVVLELERKGR